MSVLAFTNGVEDYSPIWSFQSKIFDGRKSRSPSDSNGLRVAIMIISSKQSNEERIPNLMEVWGRKMMKHPLVADLTFITIDVPGFDGIPHAQIPEKYADLYKRTRHYGWMKVNAKLVIKTAYTMRYCVDNTDADWCIRAMDDTFLPEEGFWNMIKSLREKGNPREVPLAAGNCIVGGNFGFYLQGGSGWVFSRKAAEMMVEREEKWITSIRNQEDYHIGSIIKEIGISQTGAEVDYGGVSGHFMPKERYETFSWENVSTCPESLPPEQACNHQLHPYRNMGMLHSWDVHLTHSDWVEWLKKVPEDAMIYYTGGTMHLCRTRNATNQKM